MKAKIKNYSKSVKFLFLGIGIIATIAYRLIIVLNFYSPDWVKIAWYIGTIGFIFYFGFRFDIQRRESMLVKDYDLVEAVKMSGINRKQKKVLSHVVKTLATSKAKWTSLFIFLISSAVLILGIVLDLGWISFG